MCLRELRRCLYHNEIGRQILLRGLQSRVPLKEHNR